MVIILYLFILLNLVYFLNIHPEFGIPVMILAYIAGFHSNSYLTKKSSISNIRNTQDF